MKRNVVKTRGYYIAFPDETLHTIRAKIATRKQIEQFLGLPHVSAYLTGTGGAATFLDRLSGIYTRHWSGAWASACRRCGDAIENGLRRAFLSIALPVAKFIIQALQANSYDRVTSRCDEQLIPPRPEEAFAGGQTSFTVFATVKPTHRIGLWLLLPLVRLFAKYCYPPGNFAEVFTLHSFRWILLDNGDRLIFQSIFDGTWENYMGDFIDKIVWALDFVYANTEGYPPAGMREVVAFKEWIRAHQPYAEVVYNAYPSETVLNLLRDREIADTLGTSLDAAGATRWLELL
jgi:hypothetical protein